MADNFTYGIDFGTTNSTITVVDGNGEVKRIEVDPDSPNPAVMRTVIYVRTTGEMLFGGSAINAYVKDIAEGKVAKSKLVFTGKYLKLAGDADLGGVKDDKIVPEIIEIQEGEGGRLIQSIKSTLGSKLDTFEIFGKKYKVEELVGSFLRNMKLGADEIVGEDVKSVVIGRPIKYVGGDEDIAIEKMTAAAGLAGFESINFEYEPIGAAYDYGIDTKENHTALMFDFGGGTLDLTVMKFPEKEVLSNCGLPLGGDLLNSSLFSEKISKHFGKGSTYGEREMPMPDHIYEKLKNWYTISIMKTDKFADSLENLEYKNSNPVAIKNLKHLVFDNLGFGLYQEIDKTKVGLSNLQEDKFKFDSMDVVVEEYVSRDEFEDIISNHLGDVEKLINETLETAKIKEDQIDVVATTGGSSLIPSVKKLLIKRFGENKLKDSDAFTSVSTGLALKAHETYSK